MRTIKDFFSYYLQDQLFGPAHINKFSRSCACGHTAALATFQEGGMQFTVTTSDVKVPKSSKRYLRHSIVNKKFKLKSGKYLHFDFLVKKEGRAAPERRVQYRETRIDGEQTEEFITFSITWLGILLNNLEHGFNNYNYTTHTYDAQPKATKEELSAIRKEFRSIVKDKLVGILFDNALGDYNKSPRIVDKARTVLGLFAKKPRFAININNSVHPREQDYLTLQLYQY
jgi:hypothetical protein